MFARIDLRRDLPKVRAQLVRVLSAQARGACDYTAPCVIGAMVNPRKRPLLEHNDLDDTLVGTLLYEGLLKAPAEQHNDLRVLQAAFDSQKSGHFLRALGRAEAKYSASGIGAATAGETAKQGSVRSTKARPAKAGDAQ